MSVREELHDLVDQLEDDHAPEALAYLRRLVQKEHGGQGSTDPDTNSGQTTYQPAERNWAAHDEDVDLATLAKQQRVRPIASPDDLKANFWPEDESIDEFVETIRRWRREGGYA